MKNHLKKKKELLKKTKKEKKKLKNLKTEFSLIQKLKGFYMPTGKVKWFNSKKGYGFITDEETEKDIFLHVSALEESKLRMLKEEQKLEFEIKEENNKLQAINLKKI